jgi:hypothetical protein
MTRTGLLLIAAAGLAFAAGPLSGPVAGYLAGPDGTELRAILGVPGALRYSDRLPLPQGTTRVRMASGKDYALIERKSGGPAVVVLSGGAIDHVTPVPGAISAADWASFSVNGTAVVLYSAAAGRLQVLSGLPDSPQLALDLDAASLPEQPAIAAISDDAKLLVCASRQTVYGITAQGAQLLLSGSAIQALAVLPNGKDAVVADAGAGSVYRLPQGSGPRAIASGIGGITGMWPTSDGATLYLTRQGAQSVSAVDLSSGAVQEFPAAIAPTGLAPLRIRDSFLISAESGQPGWIFYRDGGDGRTVFIPAIPPETARPPRGGVR